MKTKRECRPYDKMGRILDLLKPAILRATAADTDEVEEHTKKAVREQQSFQDMAQQRSSLQAIKVGSKRKKSTAVMMEIEDELKSQAHIRETEETTEQ